MQVLYEQVQNSNGGGNKELMMSIREGTCTNPWRYRRIFLCLCSAMTLIYLIGYTTLQNDVSTAKTSHEPSEWNKTDFVHDALRKLAEAHINTLEPRKKKLVLLWTSYFSDTDVWLPSTTELNCPVKECELTSNRSLLNKSSAVVLHLRNIDPEDLPDRNHTENSRVIWALFNKEAPPHTPLAILESLNDKIHLTVTYRQDSDIFAPYGEIVKRNKTFELPALNANRSMVCWLVSNCDTPSKRKIYVDKLKEYINVDVYGKCGDKTCPYSNKLDCYNYLSERCKFYLSFENSICKDYVTEKVYYAMMTDMVPIVMGGDDYSRDFPHHSFINVANFRSPKVLADYLHRLDRHKNEYLSYFDWKKESTSKDSSYLWFCDLCKRLHDTELGNFKRHENLVSWWFDESGCHFSDLS